MPYTQLTIAQAKQRIADMLGDSNKVFFTDAEIERAVHEAMRTWNTAAQYWRSRGTFGSVFGVLDLGPFLDNGGTKLLERTVTDEQLVLSICDSLMESFPILGSWTGTDKFTLSDVLGAIEEAANEFLYRTSCVVLPYIQNVGVSPPAGRVTLTNQNISDLRRVEWFDVGTNKRHHLWRVDEWALNAQNRSWSTDAQVPNSYAVTSVDPLTIQLAPVPVNLGELTIFTVQNISTLTGLGVTIDVPNDFIWAVKYGALALLLSNDGQVRDPERAAYCSQRFDEGVALATSSAASLLQVELTGVPVQIESIMDFDTTRQNWRNELGVVEQVALDGLNLMAVAPQPSAVYSFTADVVKNAPQPTGSDTVDLGREYIDTVLNYAQHILSFKMGGAEFSYTQPHLDELYKAAMEYNAKLRANGQFYDVTQARSLREKAQRPPRKEIDDGSS